MKKLLSVLAFATIAFSSVTSHALLIEPFIGYGMGDYEGDDTTGLEYGGRLGFTLAVVDIGGEFAKGDFDADRDTGGDLNLETTDMGLFIAIEFPILLRAYATYFLSSEAKPGTGTKMEGDGGYRLGVGFTGLPFLSINLEQTLRKWDEQGSSSISEDMSMTMLSISLPLP